MRSLHLSFLPRSRFSFIRTISVITLPVMLMFLIQGCGIKSSIDRAVDTIDRGIADILANSDRWQSTLQRIAQELPSDISELVRNEAQNLATRSIAQAGTEFRCDVDFLSRRATEALNRLKDLLRGGTNPPSTLPPAFCLVAPSSLNLNDSPNAWSVVTLHGYDLDHRDSSGSLLKVLFQNASGVNTPLGEDRIGRTTHYQVTVNLGNMGKTLHQNNIRKVVLSWNNATANMPEIVVIPWAPARRTDGPFTVGVTSYTPPRTRGDADFDIGDDEPTNLILRAQYVLTGSSINSIVYMKANEIEEDYTTVEGWTNWTPVYSAPIGWRIIAYRPNANAEHTTRVTSQGEQIYSRPGGEIVNRFHVWVDRDGDEAGSWTHVDVDWRTLEVTLEQTVPDWLR